MSGKLSCKAATKTMASTLPKMGPSFCYGKTYAPVMFEVDFTVADGWKQGTFRNYGTLSLMPMIGAMHYGLQCFTETSVSAHAETGKPVLFRGQDKVSELARSCHRLCFPEFDTAEVNAAILELATLNSSFIPASGALRVRTSVIGNNLNLAAAAADQVKLYMIASPMDASTVKPLSVEGNVSVNRSWPGGTGDSHLGTNYAVQVLHEGNAKAANGTDALVWTAPDGHVTSMGSVNIMLVVDGVLVTPPADGLLVEGITRDCCLQLAASWGIKVEAKNFTLAEVSAWLRSGACTEVFACGGAPVIQSVGKFTIGGEAHTVPVVADSLSAKLKSAILKAQVGDLMPEWTKL